MGPSPLLIHPDSTVNLPPVYCGSIPYYALMAAYGHAVVDTAARFDKRQKDTHRCLIADTRGPLTLTVPINKPQSATRACWSDITVSTHDSWWNIHLTSLESAYGRTPFFEFYADRFKPLFCGHRYAEGNYPLMQLDAEFDAVIREILGIDTSVEYTGESCRNENHSRFTPCGSETAVEYYQVRAHQLGFIPGLSILDLIFNLGPEAPLILRRMQQALSL